MKKLVTQEVFNKAVNAAEQMATCKGNFDIFCKGYMCDITDEATKKALQRTFESLQWYTALFPVNEITLHDPNLPAPQTVDLQRILQAIQSAKYYLASHPDNEIGSECADHISSLQEIIDYIISLSK